MGNETTALERAIALIAVGVLSIDRDGRVWRHAILTHGNWKLIEPRRAESIGGKGYFRLMLQIDGRLRGVGAHRVVWTHFKGAIPPGFQINHKDLNKQNNHPDNLELATGAENIQHSYANGRTNPWSHATVWRGKPRLTPEQMKEARQMRAGGALLREIGERFGIGTTHAKRITD